MELFPDYRKMSVPLFVTILYYITQLRRMSISEECIIESDGTIFRFSVTNKGYNDEGYYWTNTNISVENWCFNYWTSASCFEFSELKHMRDKLTSLLNDEVVSIETITFLEPDVEIVLKPKCDLLNSGNYTYIKTGYEIEDISAEFFSIY